MKTFREYVNEAFQPGPEYYFRHKNRWVIDTYHALERRDQRTTLSDLELEDFLTRMIDDFLGRSKSYTGRDGKYLYYSKKYDQAILIEYRKDGKDKGSGARQFIVVSFFEPGTQYARKDTKKIIIETNSNSPYISQACVNYLANIAKNPVICESIVENMYEDNQSLIVEDSCRNDFSIDFIFDKENKVWDIEGLEVLEF